MPRSSREVWLCTDPLRSSLPSFVRFVGRLLFLSHIKSGPSQDLVELKATRGHGQAVFSLVDACSAIVYLWSRDTGPDFRARCGPKVVSCCS